MTFHLAISKLTQWFQIKKICDLNLWPNYLLSQNEKDKRNLSIIAWKPTLPIVQNKPSPTRNWQKLLKCFFVRGIQVEYKSPLRKKIVGGQSSQNGGFPRWLPKLKKIKNNWNENNINVKIIYMFVLSVII